MFAYFRAPISWLEIVKRTMRETRADGCVGLAAQLAFYFFLALFPALIFLIALVGFIPVGPAIDNALGGLGRFAPSDVVAIVRRQLTQGGSSGEGGLLTFGALGAVWSSSAAMTAIIGALNRAYDIEEWRPWWKMRLIAILLTLGLAGFILVSLAIVMAGPEVAQALADWLGPGQGVVTAWGILQWPLAFLLVVVAIDLVYHFAPNAVTEWVWMTPGSVLATMLWLVTSLGFKLYLSRVASFEMMYGAVGSVIVVLLWFYVSGFAILLGAEMNAVIDKALPYQEAAAPATPGERKKIGPAAERAHDGSRGPTRKSP
ncbi:MAG: YihY/virulence factor BrkB family protein [Acidobacteriota bacterium]|nr:YihY/virulence factor BrkB family protein [Acidobacteriota bacterium]